MHVEEQFVRLAALIGEPVRAMILWSLLDGRALTATELAIDANTSPQSASSHLQKLVEAGLLKVEKQGRHRYFHFARPEVAYAIESLASLIPGEKLLMQRAEKSQSGIGYARTCYDHLAGRVAIIITAALVERGILTCQENTFRVSTVGIQWLASLNIDAIALQKSSRRSFARQCLDWSERKPHLAGALGAAFLQQMQERGWVRSVLHSRAVVITAKGQQEINQLLGVNL